MDGAKLHEARSAAHRALEPPTPEALKAGAVSIVLFYQYIEPSWTKQEHKALLTPEKTVVEPLLDLAKKQQAGAEQKAPREPGLRT